MILKTQRIKLDKWGKYIEGKFYFYNKVNGMYK